ncbi:MAG: cobalamin-dependent protein [Acholeplasmataceae bacterium]|nr:cobalamin-dependent protein [Acholeplasmataceae bacterium]
MGLLMHHLSDEYSKVADLVYLKQFEIDPRLETEYNDYRKKRMYEDILHNLSFLEVAHRLNDDKLFVDYAIWLFKLMVNLLKDLGPKRVEEQMVLHYEILKEALKNTLGQDDFFNVEKLLNHAIDATKRVDLNEESSNFMHGKYGIYRQNYLNYLLDSNSIGAVNYIKNLASLELSIEEIYIDILQVVMIEIGNLWHRSIITVDQEHYMTSITQVVLSQFYTQIFETKKIGRKILSCGIGGELHEMGVRMLSDLFEFHGWDSIYLGAAIPKFAILTSIEANQPDLVALSVTMPQHLLECREIVDAIKNRFPNQKIAVGGRAFQMTDKVWKKWPVDVSVNDAKELVEWANQVFKDQ